MRMVMDHASIRRLSAAAKSAIKPRQPAQAKMASAAQRRGRRERRADPHGLVRQFHMRRIPVGIGRDGGCRDQGPRNSRASAEASRHCYVASRACRRARWARPPPNTCGINPAVLRPMLDPKVPLSTTRYPFGYLVLQRNSAIMAKSRGDVPRRRSTRRLAFVAKTLFQYGLAPCLYRQSF
jgi:hypothetical protein